MAITEDRSEELEVYELGYLVLPSIPEDSLPQVVDSIKKIIKDANGTELDGEHPLKRKLAYSMSKTVGSSKYVVDDAYMGWIKFEAEPSQVEEVKSSVENLGEVLRFLLVKAPRETTFTFAQAQQAEEAEAAAEVAETEAATEPAETEEDVVQ